MAVFDEERFLLSQVLRMEHGVIRDQLDALNLQRGAGPIFFTLSGGAQMSQRALARKTRLAPATIHATVKRLTDQGFLARLPDEDGRVVRLMLTPEGERQAQLAQAVFERVHRQMLEGFTLEERLLLRRFLLQMRENLNALQASPALEKNVSKRTNEGGLD